MWVKSTLAKEDENGEGFICEALSVFQGCNLRRFNPGFLLNKVYSVLRFGLILVFVNGVDLPPGAIAGPGVREMFSIRSFCPTIADPETSSASSVGSLNWTVLLLTIPDIFVGEEGSCTIRSMRPRCSSSVSSMTTCGVACVSSDSKPLSAPRVTCFS